MTVHFVGAGPGAADLITVRAARLLERCDTLVYAGSLVSDEVLALVPARAERHDSASMTLEQIVEVMTRAAAEGKLVVRLHSGDPSLYGAIREQMIELDKRGVSYDVTPGVSSFQAAAAALKTELTAPEISQTVILTRAAGRTPVPAGQELAALAASKATLCVFLSVDKIASVVDELAPAYGAQCPAAVVYRASWPDEAVIRGTLADIAAKTRGANVNRTGMIVVGWALDKQVETASRLYAGDFAHGYRREG